MKTMKKIPVILLVVLVSFFIGCKTVEVPQKTEQTTRVETKDNFTLWTNQIPNIKYGDPINFYNEMEIRFVSKNPDYVWRLKDGRGEKVNRSGKDGFKIPTKTEGAFMHEKTPSIIQGKITYEISFFENDNICFLFQQQVPGGAFYLQRKVLVFENGKPYEIELPANSGFEKIRLLWITSDVNEETYEEHVATGKKVVGEKEMKIK